MAIGTIDLPITFTSTTEDDTSNDEDNWYGIRFDVSGCERWGYGYLGLTDPLSSIEHATISNAKYGVKIEDFAAPTLKNVQFADIAADRHIFLDRTDVFIPAGYWPSGVCNDEDPEEFVEAPGEWLLLGGTNVIASTANPLFILYADSLTTIRDSRIHHFADTGLWVKGTTGKGAVISSNTIERGEGLDIQLGLRAIRLDQADTLMVTANKLSIAGLRNMASTAAVDAYFGKNFCLTNPLPGTLYFQGNSVIGPGTDPPDPALKSGIRYDWICGAPPRKVELRDNYVEGFKFAGLEFAQCSDIQVSCNTIVNTLRAIELTRNTEATGPAVRFKSNYLEVPLEGGFEVVRSDDAVKTKMGPSQSDRGDNALVADDENVKWIRLNDAGVMDLLDARQNYWYLLTQSGRQLTVNEEPFVSRILSSGAIVDWSHFYESDANSTFCHIPPPSVGGAQRLKAELG